MKKICAVMLILCIMLSMVACGGSSADDFAPKCCTNENVTKVAEKAVEIFDGYLDMDLSREEANEAFASLQERMETMEGADASEYDYDDPNRVVLGDIKPYSGYEPIAEDKTDAEIETTRDIIAYHAGLPLRKGTREIEPFAPPEDATAEAKSIMAEAGVIGLPALGCNAAERPYYVDIGIGFDIMYGTSVQDFCDYVYDIYNNVCASSYGDNFWISASLSAYTGVVLRVSIMMIDNEPLARIARPDADYSDDDVDSDYIEFSSQSELEKEARKIWDSR